MNNVIMVNPPRAAIQGRPNTDPDDNSISDNPSTKSTPDTVPSDETSEIDVLKRKEKITYFTLCTGSYLNER